MANKVKELDTFLQDLTYNTKYVFLEEGKDDNELQEMGKKHGLNLPSRDLAIFKGIYAFVDRENKNGCTLPEEEVDKTLKTLSGKAIDIDHYRKRTIGFWIIAERQKEEIVSYGAIWKANFEEEFEDIKKLMGEGKLALSFEAWGDRIYKNRKSYDLTNIEFAGGALLFTTSPAFDGAEVLELAHKDKILEFATTMVAPAQFVYERGKQEDIEEFEEGRFHFHEYEIIARLMLETECPTCKVRGGYKVNKLDFENSEVDCECINCSAKYKIDLEPSIEQTKKGKKIKSIQEIRANIESSKIIKCPHCNNDINVNPNIQTCPICSKSIKNVDKSFEITDEENIEDSKVFEQAPAPDITENYIRLRQKNPDDFQKNSFRTITLSKSQGIKAIIGRLKGKTTTTVQSYLFDRKKWTLKEAEKWVKEHKGNIENEIKDKIDIKSKGGNNIVDELLKKYGKTSPEELVAFLDSELETIKTSGIEKDKEIAKVKGLEETISVVQKSLEEKEALIKTKDEELVKIKADHDAIKVTLESKEKAERDALIKSRKEKLGNFAENMSDEDILDNLKFENATLKKALIEKNPEVAKELELGIKDKDINTDIFVTQDRIQKKAFPKS